MHLNTNDNLCFVLSVHVVCWYTNIRVLRNILTKGSYSHHLLIIKYVLSPWCIAVDPADFFLQLSTSKPDHHDLCKL